MTNKEIMQADLLDILFEHRNKSYGAYPLRRSYNSRLLIALAIALSAVVLFYLISLLTENNRGNGSFLGDKGVVEISQITIEPPKKIELPPPVKKIVPTAQVRNLTIRIVPDPQADPEIPEQKLIESRAISNVNVDGPPPTDLNKGATGDTGKGIGEKEKTGEATDFIPAEIPPSFPGGAQALALFFSRTLSSPTDLEAGEKKIVLVRFVVGADGSITKAEVIQSGGDTYDNEVLRAFKRMPRWNPAMQNGNKIAVSFIQPVTFFGVDQ